MAIEQPAAAGQGLAVAFGVSQSARAAAVAAASAQPPSCRPLLNCSGSARTVTSALTLQRTRGGQLESLTEQQRWTRDATGSVEFEVTQTTSQPQGGTRIRRLRFLRVDGLRVGGLDGRFVAARTAPKIDERLDADPQSDFDALFEAASSRHANATRCGGPTVSVPGRVRLGTAETQGRQRSFRIESDLEDGARLSVEGSEVVACVGDTIRLPETVDDVPRAGEGAVLEAFAAGGLRDGWLVAPEPIPAFR